jgi:predicted DCC family thiol-disulfide oxidoreductase YuxK
MSAALHDRVEGTPAETPILLYDGACGFCRWFINGVDVHVRANARLVAFQDFDLQLVGIMPSEAMQSIQWVDSSGARVRQGADALSSWLRSSPHRRWRTSGWLLGMPPMICAGRVVYRQVARRRHLIPARWACVGQSASACSVAPPPRRPAEFP